MTKINAVIGSLVAIIIVLIAIGTNGKNAGEFGSAPAGIIARVATSSPYVIGSTASTITATTSCIARVITTKTQPILLTFSDAYTPSSTYGHIQTASSTVAYDAEVYGCGLMRVQGMAADTITVTEIR